MCGGCHSQLRVHPCLGWGYHPLVGECEEEVSSNVWAVIRNRNNRPLAIIKAVLRIHNHGSKTIKDPINSGIQPWFKK
jgi:hypothetical protein